MTSRVVARPAALSAPDAVAAWLHYGSLVAIVAAGGWLRLTALRRQSLWFDEIDIVVRANRPFDQVLRTFVTEGENGPLFNLLLALWVRVAGLSEIAVRFPSAIAGTLALPLIYLLARRLVSPTVGLYAAGLLAVNPYHVWYSQDAKMYAAVVLLGLLSTLTLVEALARNARPWWAAWVIVTSLLFYTHVTSVLLFAGQVGYLAFCGRRWPGRRRAILVSIALLTLPYVPIALWAARVVGGDVQTWQAEVDIIEAFRVFGVRFAANRGDPAVETRAAWLYLLLAAGGLLALARGRWRRPARWWVLLGLLVAAPTAGLWLVSLRQSVFSDRYAIPALPAYLLLVAAGAAWLVRSRRAWPLGLLALLMLVTLAWQPLRDVNRSTQAQKEDWRSAWAAIAREAQPGDVFLIQPGYLVTTVEYFNERVPTLRGHRVVQAPTLTGSDARPEVAAAAIADQAAGATRIWLVQSPDRLATQDPGGVLASWLDASGVELKAWDVNGVRVKLYELRGGTRADGEEIRPALHVTR